ncbi:MAG TPA: hypothetical protein VK281_01640 [Xanthobacteraceae bacterium]|nr:hypothetical protein [Xanthobacteraceae bacterium]
MTFQRPDMPAPGDWLVDTVRRKPEALLLMAAGCALLMRSGMRSARRPAGSVAARMAASDQSGRPRTTVRSATSAVGDSVGRAAGAASDFAGDVAGTVSDTAKSVAGNIGDTASNVVDNVAGYAGAARRTVADYADDARRSLSLASDRLAGQADATYQSATDAIREQPVLVAALGLAAGAAVAALFPSTDIERRTLGPARDALTGAAADAGQKVVDAAGKAGDRLKETVTERGLDSDGLKDVARDVAGTFAAAAASTEQDRRTPGQTNRSLSVSGPRPSLSGGEKASPPLTPVGGTSISSGRTSDQTRNLGAKDSRTAERSSNDPRRA